MSSHWTLVFTLALGAAAPQCTPTAELKPLTKRMPMTPIPHPRLSDFGLETWPLSDWYKTIEEANFTVLESLPDVLAEEQDVSESNCRGFLQPSFVPYEQPNDSVEWAISVAEPGGIDLLRAIYEVDGFEVRFYGSINFSRVDLVRRADSPREFADLRAFIEYITVSVVLAHAPPLHTWQFVIPEHATPPILITNAGAPEVANVLSRHDRLDIMVSSEVIYVQFYNKIHQYMNYRASDAWFNDGARLLFRREPE